jgi:hypothetical protein
MKISRLVFIVLFMACWLPNFAQQYYRLNLKGMDRPFTLSPNNASILLEYTSNDSLSLTQQIPFVFYYYGKLVQTYKVSSTGVISFDTSLQAIPSNNVSIADSNAPQNCIYAFWDQTELNPFVLGVDTIASRIISYANLTGLRKSLTLQWQLLRPQGSKTLNAYAYYAVVLYEDGEIEILHQYGTGNFSASVGLKGAALDTLYELAGSPNLPVGGNHLNYLPEAVNRYRFIPGLQPQFDLAITNFSIPFYQEKDSLYGLNLSLFNNGWDSVSNATFAIAYEGGDTLYRQATTQLAASGGMQKITLNNLSPSQNLGYKKLHIWITKINGQSEQNFSNSSIAQTQFIYISNYPKKLLHEVFSASTVGNAKAGVENMSAILKGQEQDYTYLLYPMNFPNFGDPYYQPFCGERFLYYEATLAPWLSLNGNTQWSNNTNPVSTAYTSPIYQQQFKQNALVNMELSLLRNDTQFKVSGSLKATAPMLNQQLKLHLALVEKVTYNNKRNTNEKEFYNVVKAMMPNANGRPISFNAQTEINFEDSFTFMGNYRLPGSGDPNLIIDPSKEHSVENFDHIYAIAFLQDDTDKMVWQSDASELQWPLTIKETQAEDFLVYPNPCVNMLTIELPKALSALEVKVFSSEGKLHLEKQLTPQQNTLDCSNLPAGIYVLSLSAGEKNSYKKVVISY